MGKKYQAIDRLGSALIAGGLAVLFFIFWPVLKQETSYRFNQAVRPDYRLVDNKEATASAKSENKPKPFSLIFKPVDIYPKSYDFSLVIPKIGVNELVLAGVDSGNEEEYLAALKQGVAQAKNSALPDQSGPVFIFGHSTDSFYNITRYNAFFYLLSKLTGGDEVYIFYRQKKYQYEVTESKIVQSEEVTDEVKKLGNNELVLQTCWPPGTTLKRLIVIAKRL